MRRASTLLSVLFIAAYFIWFAFDGTRVGWTEDDPMNLYMYWKPGLAKVLQSNLTFWTGFYRPVGGLFYLPIYAIAGMNPAPYRWTIFALLALNVFLVHKLAFKLTASRRVAGLACLFACVHGAMADLVYNTSSIYDVLAVTFSLLTLIVYVNKPLTLSRFAGVLALMILAINAKEIAATLPAFFLLYEIFFEPLSLRRNIWPSFAALAVASIAMYGKMHGPDAMTANEAYRPILAFSRWLEANVAYTATILYQQSMPTLAAIGLWIGMAVLAALCKSRTMAWALGVLLLSTIPISFIPQRLGGSLYLPLIASAIWFAAFLDWLISRLPDRRFPWKAIATAALAVAFWCWTAYGFIGKGDAWRQTQGTPNRVLAVLENFHYRPPHDKRILFVGSPYKTVYDLVFLANLVWNDRTLQIHDANLTQADRSQFDIVIGFKDDGGALEVLKQ